MYTLTIPYDELDNTIKLFRTGYYGGSGAWGGCIVKVSREKIYLEYGCSISGDKTTTTTTTVYYF